MRRILGLALLVATLLSPSVAFAGTGYRPSHNTVVNLTAPVSLPNLGTGALTFAAQEGVYSATGLDVPHDYVILEVNGRSVLALDPLCIYGK